MFAGYSDIKNTRSYKIRTFITATKKFPGLRRGLIELTVVIPKDESKNSISRYVTVGGCM
jgi:hypothetical protein